MRLLSRRQWLVGTAGVLVVAMSSLCLRKFFDHHDPFAAPKALPSPEISARFMAVSKILTDSDRLQPDLARALYDALYHPQLDAQLEALSAA